MLSRILKLVAVIVMVGFVAACEKKEEAPKPAEPAAQTQSSTGSTEAAPTAAAAEAPAPESPAPAAATPNP